jgi:hypothetical protein
MSHKNIFDKLENRILVVIISLALIFPFIASYMTEVLLPDTALIMVALFAAAILFIELYLVLLYLNQLS